MKDEIKEILDINIGDDREAYIDYIDKDGKRKNYEYIEAEDLLDYITNLQTIEQQYSAILSENAELENKITNLQEENERLKEENKHIFANVNDDQLLRSNAMNYAELQDYKQRNEKASTYIEYYLIGNIAKAENCQRSLKYLLNILQGSDE